ncbi:MAG: TIGR02300 family protein [Holosporaceae bacterium]|jgi:uncharacterized protein (TIGR02300 family)|nr:TIGR02300 family protein [Holosporaceae bacterium]
MNRKDWGIKRVCHSCSARFYDFNKSPIICPACGAAFDLEYQYKRKTKSFYEKNEDVEDIPVDNEILEDEEVDDAITTLEDGEDISIDDDAKDR